MGVHSLNKHTQLQKETHQIGLVQNAQIGAVLANQIISLDIPNARFYRGLHLALKNWMEGVERGRSRSRHPHVNQEKSQNTMIHLSNHTK